MIELAQNHQILNDVRDNGDKLDIIDTNLSVVDTKADDIKVVVDTINTNTSNLGGDTPTMQNAYKKSKFSSVFIGSPSNNGLTLYLGYNYLVSGYDTLGNFIGQDYTNGYKTGADILLGAYWNSDTTILLGCVNSTKDTAYIFELDVSTMTVTGNIDVSFAIDGVDNSLYTTSLLKSLDGNFFFDVGSKVWQLDSTLTKIDYMDKSISDIYIPLTNTYSFRLRDSTTALGVTATKWVSNGWAEASFLLTDFLVNIFRGFDSSNGTPVIGYYTDNILFSYNGNFNQPYKLLDVKNYIFSLLNKQGGQTL